MFLKEPGVFIPKIPGPYAIFLKSDTKYLSRKFGPESTRGMLACYVSVTYFKELFDKISEICG